MIEYAQDLILISVDFERHILNNKLVTMKKKEKKKNKDDYP